MNPILAVFLCNIPAYIGTGLAIWRKLDNGEYYEATVTTILTIILVCDAFLCARVLDPDQITREAIISQQNTSTLIIPLLFMFHSPSGGAGRITPTTIILFALTLILFMPAIALDWDPYYSKLYAIEPTYDCGISLSIHGHHVYYMPWAALILILQSIVSLRQVRKIIRLVKLRGAKYSRTTKAVLLWDFSCGFYLSTFLLFPVTFWQQPAMRWAFYILSSLIITVGSILIFLGFDINPVSDADGKHFSIKDFVMENSDLYNRCRHIIEEENICLERGIQAETVIQRLDTNHLYFERMIRAIYGCSFPELVNQRRIQYAQELLCSGYKSVDSVAIQAGYPGTQTFLAMYERVTGEKFQTF